MVTITTRSIRLVKLLATLILTLTPLLTPTLASAREQVISKRTVTPPTIDGTFTANEWSNPQITMKPDAYPIEAYAYFQNDDSTLYVMVDAVGDGSDDKVESTGRFLSDESLLVFNFTKPVTVHIRGIKGDTVKSGFNAIIGFADSPNSNIKHKIYEFSIPFKFIHAKPGQNVDFCSPAGFGGYEKGYSITYDVKTKRDNIWPLGLNVTDINTWGILILEGTSVPELSNYAATTMMIILLVCLIIRRKHVNSTAN